MGARLCRLQGVFNQWRMGWPPGVRGELDCCSCTVGREAALSREQDGPTFSGCEPISAARPEDRGRGNEGTEGAELCGACWWQLQRGKEPSDVSAGMLCKTLSDRKKEKLGKLPSLEK